MTRLLALNTDFAQVEADNQQVNLTRFSLFFPEKRQFFLESASLFDFDLGGSNRLFYSRRIGLQDGEAVRLLDGRRPRHEPARRRRDVQRRLRPRQRRPHLR
jgi:hypothetical protein